MGFQLSIYRADDALLAALRMGVPPQEASAFANQIKVFLESDQADDRRRISEAFEAHRGQHNFQPGPEKRYDIARVLTAYVAENAVPAGEVSHNTRAGVAFRDFISRLSNMRGLGPLAGVLADPTIIGGWSGYPSIGSIGRVHVAAVANGLRSVKFQDEDEMLWLKQLRQAVANVEWGHANLVATYH